MTIKYYIFEENGPYNWERANSSYNWERANSSSGPYYNKHYYFDREGYDTLEDAEFAIEKYLTNNYSTLFILKGYSR